MSEILALILLASTTFQLILAYFTANDARSRGHDRLVWFILVLIFGVFTVLIYLLVRNDETLPEAERPDKRNLRKFVRPTCVFGIAAIFGLVVFTVIGGVIAPSVYPEPETDCSMETVEINGQEAGAFSCESQEDYQKTFRNNRNRNNFQRMFGVLGFAIVPAGLFVKRRVY